MIQRCWGVSLFRTPILPVWERESKCCTPHALKCDTKGISSYWLEFRILKFQTRKEIFFPILLQNNFHTFSAKTPVSLKLSWLCSIYFPSMKTSRKRIRKLFWHPWIYSFATLGLHIQSTQSEMLILAYVVVLSRPLFFLYICPVLLYLSTNLLVVSSAPPPSQLFSCNAFSLFAYNRAAT